MSRFWLLQTGEPIYTDADGLKKMRCMSLCDQLLSKGHEVHIFTSSFYHQKKIHRSKEYKKITIGSNCWIHLIPSPGYNKNISIMRIIDHAFLGLNLIKILKLIRQEEIPKSIFIGFPPIETSLVMQNWASRHQIPTVVDVKDQWPLIFIEPFPRFMRPFARIAFLPYFWMTKKVFQNASAVTTISQPFLEWIYDFSNRSQKNADDVYPLTKDKLQVKPGVNFLKKELLDILENHVDDPILYFAGSLTQSFNFDPIVRLLEEAKLNNFQLPLVIFGDGDNKSKFEKQFTNFSYVYFQGWTDSSDIERFAKKSFGSVAPYINNDAFKRSIPNKVIDSMSHGKPVLTSLEGETARLINQNNCGFVTTDPKKMLNYIIELHNDKNLYSSASKNATNVYKKFFNHEKNYERLSDLLDSLV